MTTRKRLAFRHGILFCIDCALVIECALLALLIFVDRDYHALYALIHDALQLVTLGVLR